MLIDWACSRARDRITGQGNLFDLMNKQSGNNEREEIYPNIWLRDHARDEENWDKRSNQRKTFTATLDFKLKIKSAEILDNGKSIKIIWPDLEKPVTYSYEFLFNNSLNNKSKINSLKLWLL